MRSIRFSLCCAIIGSLCAPVHAYEQETHRKLSEATVEQSSLAASTDNILIDVGLSADISEISLQEFPNSNGEMKSITELIQDGSFFEDNGIRSIQHFFDPINDQSLHHFLLNVAGGTTKSPDWAIEGTGQSAQQNYSYAAAVDAFRQALTLPTKAERDIQWGRLFETLGHVIHHVQDMAQPEHVRNDIHCGELIPCGIPGAVLGLYEKSIYEWRSQDVFQDGVPGLIINYPAVSFPTAREFWTTRDTDTNVTARRGIADFTNRNFVSKDTNFELISGAVSVNRKYALPVPIVDPTNKSTLPQLLPDDGEGADICQRLNQVGPIDLPPNSPCEIEFIRTNVTDSYAPEKGGVNDRAASLSLFDQHLAKYNVGSVSVEDGDAAHMVDVDRLLTYNRFNVDAAHPFLIPRAVAYSAGVIDHFFRGRIDMVPNPNGEGWIIKNLSDEDMQGDFTLYYDHVQNVNGNDVIQRDLVSGANWIAISIPANSEIDVGGYTTPTGLLSKMLVFNGLIGAESGIAGKHFGGWKGPFLAGSTLAAGRDYFYRYADVAVDIYGNSMMAYYALVEAGVSRLKSRHYTPAGGWGEDTFLINAQSDSNGVDRPHALGMDAVGNAIVVYRTHEGSTPPSIPMWSKNYTPSTGWGGATLIANADYAYAHYFPSLDIVADGSVMLAYRGYEGNLTLSSRRYTPTGGWGVASLIEDEIAPEFYSHSLGMDAAGNALVVYATKNETTQVTSLWSRRYTEAGGWGSATLIESYSYANTGSFYSPSLSVNADGSALLAYRTYDGTTNTARLQGRSYTPGVGWGDAILIADTFIYHFHVDTDSAGNAIIFYESANGSVAVRHYTLGVGWGGEILLAAPDELEPDVYPLSMDMADNGNAVVLWRDSDGNLWSSHYTP